MKTRTKCALWGLAAVAGLAGLVFLEHWFEVQRRPTIAVWDTCENALIVLTGEYPDRPASLGGRIIHLTLLIFGTLIFGAIVGKVSSFFVTRALDKGKHMKTFKNHVIICNWNRKAAGVIKQLLTGEAKRRPDVVVISSSKVAESDDFEDQTNVCFVQDDPTHHETLSKFNARQARGVILLADEATENPDDKNALIALAIKNLETQPDGAMDIHVVSELVNIQRRRHLKEAGVDEIVSGVDYSSGIIAQTALFRGMSDVYQQLLTYSSDTNEVYFISPGAYPSKYVGMSFQQLSHAVKESASSTAEKPLLLLGVKLGAEHGEQRRNDILLNPVKKRFEALRNGDSLIVMSYDYIDVVNE